jgi:hypothetical protein
MEQRRRSTPQVMNRERRNVLTAQRNLQRIVDRVMGKASNGLAVATPAVMA